MLLPEKVFMWFVRLIPYIFGIIYALFASSIYSSGHGSRDEDNILNMNIRDAISRGRHVRNRRISSLKIAKTFLKPYEKIFGDLTLSNKFCDVRINSKEKSITCISKIYNVNNFKMCFVAKDFVSIDANECFDMMCELFNWNTKYEEIHSSLRSLALIKESVWQVKKSENAQNAESRLVAEKDKNVEAVNAQKHSDSDILDVTEESLIDVNNCSEAEMTALPGINVILAKKIIKFREEERAFKSVEDFLKTMKIKPHFAVQLEGKVCCNKINMRKVKRAKSERIIDI